VLSLAPLHIVDLDSYGQKQKAYGGWCKFLSAVLGLVMLLVPVENFSDILCMELCQKLECFLLCLNMVGTVLDPLSDILVGVAEGTSQSKELRKSCRRGSVHTS